MSAEPLAQNRLCVAEADFARDSARTSHALKEKQSPVTKRMDWGEPKGQGNAALLSLKAPFDFARFEVCTVPLQMKWFQIRLLKSGASLQSRPCFVPGFLCWSCWQKRDERLGEHLRSPWSSCCYTLGCSARGSQSNTAWNPEQLLGGESVCHYTVKSTPWGGISSVRKLSKPPQVLLEFMWFYYILQRWRPAVFHRSQAK